MVAVAHGQHHALQRTFRRGSDFGALLNRFDPGSSVLKPREQLDAARHVSQRHDTHLAVVIRAQELVCVDHRLGKEGDEAFQLGAGHIVGASLHFFELCPEHAGNVSFLLFFVESAVVPHVIQQGLRQRVDDVHEI